MASFLNGTSYAAAVRIREKEESSNEIVTRIQEKNEDTSNDNAMKTTQQGKNENPIKVVRHRQRREYPHENGFRGRPRRDNFHENGFRGRQRSENSMKGPPKNENGLKGPPKNENGMKGPPKSENLNENGVKSRPKSSDIVRIHRDSCSSTNGISRSIGTSSLDDMSDAHDDTDDSSESNEKQKQFIPAPPPASNPWQVNTNAAAVISKKFTDTPNNISKSTNSNAVQPSSPNIKASESSLNKSPLQGE